MAKIFPKTLDSYANMELPTAEVQLFRKFCQELQDDYHIFYRFRWHNPELEKPIGEIDFVIAHPERGYICLEVKGGKCSYDPSTGIWKSKDKNKSIHTIDNPFEQALIASKAVLQMIKDKLCCYIPHSYAVIFPDCNFDINDQNKKIRSDICAWQILDQRALFNLNNSVNNLFSNAFKKGCSRQNGMKIIYEIKRLHSGEKLESKGDLSSLMSNIDQRMVALTAEQMRVISGLDDNNRVLITGCAGSGKTMIALHKAKMLSEHGLKVLLICMNRPLGGYLHREGNRHSSPFIAGPFLELAIAWLRKASVPFRRAETDDFYKCLLPTLVCDYLEYIPHDFDAIIVDEGQDFSESQWMVIEMLLKDSKNSRFYIFADTNQNIFDGNVNFPKDMFKFNLTQNIRNTNQIYQAVSSCCRLDTNIKSSGIDGPEVRLDKYQDEYEMIEKIENFLEEMITNGIKPSEIVLLGTRSQENTLLKHNMKIGPFTLVGKRTGSKDLLTMTVRRFKGLESKVVVLCELYENVMKPNEILYVGMTRTTGLLYILAQTPVFYQLKEKLSS